RRNRRLVAGKRREIERRAGIAAARSADRRNVRGIFNRRRDGCLVAEHARRTRRVWLPRGIECVGTPAGCIDRRIRRRRRLRRHGRLRLRRNGARPIAGGRGRTAAGAQLLEAIFGIVLHALELHLQLLVLVLQLLDRSGELAQRVLDAVDAHVDIGAVGGRALHGLRRLPVLLRLLLFAAIEDVAEEVAVGAILRGGGAGKQQG